MDQTLVLQACAMAAGIICAGAALGAALGNGFLTGNALASMARQPEMADKLFTNMLVSVGLVESMPILCYVIAVVFVFANPWVK